jgi:hypothetical protein
MKNKITVIVGIAVLTISSLSFAEMPMKGGMMKDKAEMMEGKGGMMGMMGGKGMMGMCSMMNSMMHKQVVATNDGGIIVVAGNKITKFDKDLNVVKEVEQKMDTQGMQKMMENMKSMCPMMGSADSDTGVKKDAAAPAAEVDHASHH